MQLIVDLHPHSHFSRATSKDSTLEELYKWGKIKGINILGTGDFTHPAWFAEMREKLEPAEPGLFRLKKQVSADIDKTLPESVRRKEIRFVFSVEISTIYSKNGKVRKLHQLIIVPGISAVSAINNRLDQVGNLKSDGRPILGLDSKELLKIVVDIDKNNLFIPAHIWTPWFSLFGSKSGFDTIAEAFEELAGEIKIIETGLSSDPYMNWRLNQLKEMAIISNSDAHSPKKLGREATILDCEFDYFQIASGLKANDERLVGTIEFFPQEGMYHYDGHRSCNVCFSPQETIKHKGLCPVCGKGLTIGVDYRVGQLADKPESYRPAKHKSVEYIIPLVEIIGELKNTGVNSKSVAAMYDTLISCFGSEFDLLRKVGLKEISTKGYDELAFALGKMRAGQVHIQPGYDGVYGKIKVFGSDTDRQKIVGQMELL